MVSINSYSATLTLAAGGFVDNAKLARGEGSALTRTIRGLVDPSEAVHKQLGLLEKAYSKQAVTEATYNEVKGRLNAKLRDATGATAAHTEALRKDNALIAEGERLTRSLMSAEEKHAAQLKQLKTLLDQQAIGLQTYSRGIAQADAALKNSSMAGGGVVDSKATGGLTVLSSKLAGPIAGLVSLGAAANLAKDSLAKYGEIEKATAAFDVLTGSAEKARDTLADIRLLAARGISMSALNQSAATMLSFNVSLQDTLPSLHAIAEITRGDSERIKMMSLAFAQAGAAGKLMGQDLLQMINAGFNPLQEISRKTGRSIVDLRDDMSAGLISFAMVKDAFISATSEGGKFNGMLDKMAETTAGATMQMTSKFENLKISLGEAISPLAKEGITALDPFIGKAKETTDSIKGISTALVSLKSSMKDFNSLSGDFFKNLKFELPVLKQFSDTNEQLRKAQAQLGMPDVLGGMRGLPGKASSLMTPFGQTQAAGIAADRANALQGDTQKRLEALERLRAKGMATEKELGELRAREEADALRKSVTARMAWSDELVKKEKEAKDELRKKELADRQSALAAEAEKKQKAFQAEQEKTREIQRQNDLKRQQMQAQQTLAKPSPLDVGRIRQEAMEETKKNLRIESPQAKDVNSQAAADWLANWKNQASSAEANKNQGVINATKEVARKLDEANRNLAKIAETQPRNKR